MALYRKCLLTPCLNMLFCNYVVLFLPEIGINNSVSLDSFGVWLVINHHFRNLPKATRQRIDNYITVIYVEYNGNNHAEFPECRQRSY